MRGMTNDVSVWSIVVAQAEAHRPLDLLRMWHVKIECGYWNRPGMCWCKRVYV